MGKKEGLSKRRRSIGFQELGDQINIALYSDTLAEIRALADAHGYTVSAVVRLTVEAGLPKVKDRLRKAGQREQADAKPKTKRRRKPVQATQEAPLSKREQHNIEKDRQT